MDNKNIIITVAGVIGVAILAFILRPTVVVQPAPVQVVTQGGGEQIVGSVASPDIASPYLSFGDVRQWAAGATLNQAATSTLCSIRSPYATTTLVSATLGITNKAGTQTFNIGLSTNSSNSTTTLLAGDAVVASTWLSLVATTTLTNGTLTSNVVLPLSWINFKVASGTPGIMAYKGKCSAVFREI